MNAEFKDVSTDLDECLSVQGGDYCNGFWSCIEQIAHDVTLAMLEYSATHSPVPRNEVY